MSSGGSGSSDYTHSLSAKGGSGSSLGRSDSNPLSTGKDGSSDSDPSAAGKGGCNGSPDSSGSNSSSSDKDHLVVLSELLRHIHGYYSAALDRLPVMEIPELIPRLLDAGVCFGLMDPVSNIIANTASSSWEVLPKPNAAVKSKKRTVEAVTEEEDKRPENSRRKRTVEAATEEEDGNLGNARKRNVVAAGEEGNNKSVRGRKRKKEKKSLAAADEEEAQRLRDEIMSKITTDVSSIVYLPPRLGRGSSSEPDPERIPCMPW